jgi:hypothetical protein
VDSVPRATQLGELGSPEGTACALDRDWLFERIYGEGLGVEEIARRTPGLLPAQVRRYMEKYGYAEPNGNGHRRPDPARAKELDASIRQTATLIERAWVALAEKLFELHERELWRDLGFGSFSAYLESLELSRSHCVRLVRVYRAFVIEGGVARERLDAIGNAHKLDLIATSPLPLAAEEALEDVSTLTLPEIKAKYLPHLEPQPECPTCHRPMPRKPGRPKQDKFAA